MSEPMTAPVAVLISSVPLKASVTLVGAPVLLLTMSTLPEISNTVGPDAKASDENAAARRPAGICDAFMERRPSEGAP